MPRTTKPAAAPVVPPVAPASAEVETGAPDAVTLPVDGAPDAPGEPPAAPSWPPPPVVTVTVRAPGGPRRRAGLAFDKAARVLTPADLGPDPEATIAALSADPRLSLTVAITDTAD